LTRPGMYIGSVEEDSYETWVLNDDSKMVKRQIKCVPGLFKIFDEILVNAIDHSVRLKSELIKDDSVVPVKNIKVVIDKETGVFEVMNDGNGIEVVKHPEHDVYIPELILGNMLTSTNYDDTEEKIIGGQNGLGGKIANIFSMYFEVETIDYSRKLLYTQRFEDNMSVIHPPKITKCSKKPYTIIRFKPDYVRFNLKNGLSDDMYSLCAKRVYDTCAVTDDTVNVHFNGKKLEYKTFEKYVDLFIGSKSDHTRVFEKIDDRWEIVATYSDFNGFEQTSFVNGIWTIRGGKHVEFILNQIVKKLGEMISKKHKNVSVKPQTIKDNLVLFVKSTISNPTFDSQTKETLTTPSTKFGGSKPEVSEKFIEKLFKSGIIDKVLSAAQVNDAKSMQKTDGKKRTAIRGLPKLEDANWAGGPKSKECTLILTEGDSAASMAIAGLSEVGRDRYGVFPLKGKLMNVKDQTLKKIAENDEITNLKKIIGLESGKEYKDIDGLRYGKIMLMTDADCDGSHIKGLLFNLYHSLWPSLIKRNDFVTAMLTPIVKVSKGKVTHEFYNLTDFENWSDENSRGNGWDIKYYKGLGTSTADEAKSYFRKMRTISYKYCGQQSDDKLDLAFNKKKADDRKEWLSNYNRQSILDYRTPEVTYKDFIDKELIHFSNYDVERSIPNICDGLKVSQRKILFAVFKKKLTKEIKVAQLAGYVSENAAYHHGEASLQSAIIGMAQDFVGSNNINLLRPNGQFGSKRCGGKDAGSPRYIYTMLSDITHTLFKKEDASVLKYLNDDGLDVEPEYYMPIIPMILVNGAVGIGTGFSTNIPCYNPLDIVQILEKMLDGDTCEGEDDLRPWYRGFKGIIEKSGNKWVSRGLYKKTSATKIEISELPIGFWTQDFKEHLEEYMDKTSDIKSYESQSTDTAVKFVLHFTSGAVCDKFMEIENNGYSKLMNDLKLVSSRNLGTTNMYLFNAMCQIKKYDSTIDIIREFYETRLAFYQKRKDSVIKKLAYDVDLVENKKRFIKAVISGELRVQDLKKNELEEYLETSNYMKHEGRYEYILRIPIYNLTVDKVDDLEAEYSKLKKELNDIEELDIKTWWRNDLQQFLKEYESH
jgi:DNA topoisomerase-2